MICSICALKNRRAREQVERALYRDEGVLNAAAREELKEEFSELAKDIDAIDSSDCTLHYNFHQSAQAPHHQAHTQSLASNDAKDNELVQLSMVDDVDTGDITNTETENELVQSQSLAGDIGKDEAEVLYQLLNEQAATMTLLSNKINRAFCESDDNMGIAILNPNTATFYQELGKSMRETVREISELNLSLNGKKDGAAEGLKALAIALADGRSQNNETLETKQFDD